MYIFCVCVCVCVYIHVQHISGGWHRPEHSSQLDTEISRAKRLVSKLGK